MTTEATARYRYQVYHCLSQIMLQGMTDDALATVRNIIDLPTTASRSIDDWKAMHYALFGLNVYPYATEFLSEDGFFGGTITQSLLMLYRDADYKADDNEPLDHTGNQLGFLASLSLAEAQAHQEDIIQAIYHNTNLQRQAFDEQVLPWTPALVMAIHEQGDEIFSIFADFMLDTLIQHRLQLGDDSAYPTQTFTLPPPPDILNREGTGFREIADYLLTPIYSGLYFSRDDIVRLSQQLALPQGHGKRQSMFTYLMNTAIEERQLDNLLQLIENKAHLWQSFYQQQITIPQFADAWIDRLGITLKFIATIRSAL